MRHEMVIGGQACLGRGEVDAAPSAPEGALGSCRWRLAASRAPGRPAPLAPAPFRLWTQARSARAPEHT